MEVDEADDNPWDWVDDPYLHEMWERYTNNTGDYTPAGQGENASATPPSPIAPRERDPADVLVLLPPDPEWLFSPSSEENEESEHGYTRTMPYDYEANDDDPQQRAAMEEWQREQDARQKLSSDSTDMLLELDRAIEEMEKMEKMEAEEQEHERRLREDEKRRDAGLSPAARALRELARRRKRRRSDAFAPGTLPPSPIAPRKQRTEDEMKWA